jgi:serine/threonine-protein kinase
MDKDKGFLSEFEDQPESFSEEVFIEAKKKSPVKFIFGVALILIALGVISFALNPKIKLTDFTGQRYEEVIEWAKTNDLKVVATKAYSEQIEKGNVISQSQSNQKLKKGDSFNIVVSDGPDPEEEIEKPDFLSMTRHEINEFIELNKMTGIKVVTEYSDSVAKDSVIGIKFEDDELFKRKIKVEITISKGKESESTSVVIPDFSTYSVEMIKEWATQNNVEVELSYSTSYAIAKDQVIKQSIGASKQVSRSTKIEIEISKGKKVTVPHFAYYSIEDATVWAQNNGIELKIKEKYSDNILKGYAITQSLKKDSIVDEGTELTLDFSLGKIKLYDFSSQPFLEFQSWFEEVNLKNGKLKIKTEYYYSDTVPKGNIISHTKRNSFVDLGSEITVVISKGGGTFLPNFVGMTQDEVSLKCTENNLKCIYVYDNSSIEKGKVISQEINSGSLVSTDELIKIHISKGND